MASIFAGVFGSIQGVPNATLDIKAKVSHAFARRWWASTDDDDRSQDDPGRKKEDECEGHGITGMPWGACLRQGSDRYRGGEWSLPMQVPTWWLSQVGRPPGALLITVDDAGVRP